MRLFVPLSSLLVMATGAAVGVLVAMNGSVASWAQTSLAINAWTSPALTPRQMRPPLNRTGLVIKPMGESASPEFVRLRDDEVRVSYGCNFDGCGGSHPFVYLCTSHRNRGASLNRWLRSALKDLESSVNEHPRECVCAAIADYDDKVSGVTVDEALQDWPLDKAVVRLEGVFSRAGGFQRIMDHLVKTPREESILFFVDADMVAYPGLLNRVLRNTIRGHWMFVPVIWTTLDPAFPNRTSEYAGYWRETGRGMIAFYLSDTNAFGGVLPAASKTNWGSEDIYIVSTFQKVSRVHGRRECTPELWHFFHPKAHWHESLDGQLKLDQAQGQPAVFSDDWRLPLLLPDAAEHLIAAREDSTFRVSTRLLFLGQYVCVSINTHFAASGGRTPTPGPEIVNTLLFLRFLSTAAYIPKSVVDRFVPSYILEAASLPDA